MGKTEEWIWTHICPLGLYMQGGLDDISIWFSDFQRNLSIYTDLYHNSTLKEHRLGYTRMTTRQLTRQSHFSDTCLWHILSSISLPPGAQQKKNNRSVRVVEVYWSCRSVRLQSAIMCRGDKSGYFFSFLVGCVSTDRDKTKHRITHSPLHSQFPG